VARPTKATKGGFCPLSHPPCTLCSSSSCLSASLADGYMGPTLPLLAHLNSSFRWRDHLRLIAFHPLLVRSFGGLARGALSIFFMCLFQMAVMHCHLRLVLDAVVRPTQEHSFFELIQRPYQAVACGHPQMSSQLGRP
jgi:hypothetical protein